MQEIIDKYLDIIAKNIKSFRENANLSQEALAEKINLSREFINRVENRKENISLKSLLMMAAVFDVNPNSFFK